MRPGRCKMRRQASCWRLGMQVQDDFHQRLAAMVEAMPAFPESVHRVMALTSDINCSPKDLVRVIESDPVMTMKILKLVNSAYFALSRTIATIHHALVYLGLNTVKNLAISIATVDALPRSSIPELPMSDFLRHSLATALAAQFLAREKLKLRDASDHFVAGLLHDFGKAVLIQYEPRIYAGVLREAERRGAPLHEVEQERIGISHAEVGGMLAESWQLPASLVVCIREQVNCSPDSPEMTLSVAAANHVAKAMQIGRSGNPVGGEFPDFMRQRLGCTVQEVAREMDGLADEVEAMQAMVRG